MPVQIFNGNAYFGIPMPLVNFPQLLTDFLNENPDTPAIEALAAQLMQSNFPDHSMDDFVTRVCGWGGKQGNKNPESRSETQYGCGNCGCAQRRIIQSRQGAIP